MESKENSKPVKFLTPIQLKNNKNEISKLSDKNEQQKELPTNEELLAKVPMNKLNSNKCLSNIKTNRNEKLLEKITFKTPASKRGKYTNCKAK